MKAAVQRLFSPNGSREPSVVGTQSRTGSVQGGDNHHRQPLDRQSNWSGSGPRSEIDDRDKRWAQQGATSAGPQPVRLPRPPDPPAPENAQKPPPVPKGDVRRLLALPENERKVLASRRHVFFKTADRGDCILRKGDPVKCVYVILSGLVMVFRSGNNYADYSVGPGDLFGDEVFSNTKSMKTFRAANEITYVEVDSHFFMKSELMSSFRVQMARGGDGELSPGGVAGGKKAGTRTEEEEREATTTTNSSRAATERGFSSPDGRGSEAGGISSTFFAPVGSICTFGAAVPQSPGAAYQGRGGPALDRTPTNKKPAATEPANGIFCYFPESIFTWST